VFLPNFLQDDLVGGPNNLLEVAGYIRGIVGPAAPTIGASLVVEGHEELSPEEFRRPLVVEEGDAVDDGDLQVPDGTEDVQEAFVQLFAVVQNRLVRRKEVVQVFHGGFESLWGHRPWFWHDQLLDVVGQSVVVEGGHQLPVDVVQFLAPCMPEDARLLYT